MTYFLLIWISVSTQCPGGIFGRFMPAAVKPFLCEEKRTIELKIEPRRRDAIKRIRKLGADTEARLYECKNLKCKERPIVWSSVLEIKK